jgi:heptosyltransferase I
VAGATGGAKPVLGRPAADRYDCVVQTPPPRILIVKLTAIGDVIHAMPVAAALREAFPGAHIGWLAEGRCGDLLRGHPALDELLVVRRRWLKSPREVWRLRGMLRPRRFDVAIDLQGLTKSAVASWLSGAKRRIGFGGAMGREASTWLNNEHVVPMRRHIVEMNLELLRPLGIASPAVRFRLPRYAEQAALVERHLQQLGLSERFAVINPAAGWSSKLWPPERFAVVARHLEQVHGLPVLVVWGGPDERPLAERIVGEARGSALLAPSTSLWELAELARRAALFVASDTGPLHLAAAVGTPCVGLFGPMPAERNGPYGTKHMTVQKMQLPPSQRRLRRTDPTAMLAIMPEDVCRACDEAIEKNALARRAA